MVRRPASSGSIMGGNRPLSLQPVMKQADAGQGADVDQDLSEEVADDTNVDNEEGKDERPTRTLKPNSKYFGPDWRSS